MKLNAGNTIYLSGKTHFGKQFVNENGNKFKVVKVQTWGEEQLLLRNLTKGSEVELIWINLYPTSKNFSIDEVVDGEEDEEIESQHRRKYKWWIEDKQINDEEVF
tara:strand:+ start:390 stop:704 length:315 start_codon:yes stop_codon:yes gene_type:complete